MNPQTPNAADQTFRDLLQIQSVHAWLWLSAFGLIALAVMLWAIFGKIIISADAQAHIQGTDVILSEIAPDDLPWIAIGQTIYVCDAAIVGSITAVDGAIVTARLTHSSTSESCPARVVLQEFRPIQRLLP